MVNEVEMNAEQRLTELADRFDQWRSTKTRRGEPIPESLWAEAVSLSKVLPRSHVRRRLRLSDRDLQKRQGVDMAKPRRPVGTAPKPHFVELTETLVWPDPSSSARAEVLFERLDGARVQLRYSGNVSDLAPLVHGFLTAR